MNKKARGQIIWWALFVGALLAAILFVFVPLSLVGHFVGALAPDGNAAIGIFYSLGLSLSIITMSGLAYFRTELRWRIGVAVLAIAEGAISFAAFWVKVNGDIAQAIGLFGVIAIQETAIFLCGAAMFVAINQIRNPFGSEQKRTNIPNERPPSEPTPNERRTARGLMTEQILELHRMQPALGVNAIAAELKCSKSHVSEVLKAARKPIGFDAPTPEK